VGGGQGVAVVRAGEWAAGRVKTGFTRVSNDRGTWCTPDGPRCSAPRTPFKYHFGVLTGQRQPMQPTRTRPPLVCLQEWGGRGRSRAPLGESKSAPKAKRRQTRQRKRRRRGHRKGVRVGTGWGRVRRREKSAHRTSRREKDDNANRSVAHVRRSGRGAPVSW